MPVRRITIGGFETSFPKKKSPGLMAKVVTPENQDKDILDRNFHLIRRSFSGIDEPWRYIPGNVAAAGIRSLPSLPDKITIERERLTADEGSSIIEVRLNDLTYND